jgi:hypothetical protein
MLGGVSYLLFLYPRGRRRRLGRHGVCMGGKVLSEEADTEGAGSLLGDLLATEHPIE